MNNDNLANALEEYFNDIYVDDVIVNAICDRHGISRTSFNEALLEIEYFDNLIERENSEYIFDRDDRDYL